MVYDGFCQIPINYQYFSYQILGSSVVITTKLIIIIGACLLRFAECLMFKLNYSYTSRIITFNISSGWC